LAMETDWKGQQRLWGHSFHPMCSYLGSFPAALAHASIARYSRAGDVVIDPFSGRGTVALQACAERRIGVGVDLNPLAVLLTGAKTDAPSHREAEHRLDQLRIDWSRVKPDWLALARGAAMEPEVALVPAPQGSGRILEPLPAYVTAVFHASTLARLLFLRGTLDRTRRADRLLLAATIGILHGKSASYLSTAMPNAFSLAPAYTRRFLDGRGLDPPERDVFHLLSTKLHRLFRDGQPAQTGIALGGDARHAGPRIRAALGSRGMPHRARLLVSSPPYLRVMRYGSYNWLRLWFLGHDPAQVDRDTTPPAGTGAYGLFLRQVLTSARDVLTDDAVLVLVLGDVATDRGRSLSAATSLAQRVWELAAEPTGYRLAGVVADPVAPRLKVTRMWGAEAGRATAVDRLLILGASESGRRRALAGAPVPIEWGTRRERPKPAAILAAYAADVSPGRPGGDGPAGAHEKPGPRPDDQPSTLLRASAAAPPVRTRGEPGA
ncbi:MAG: site-specific DNA-methyltransferase, partial [Chloroflexota bacterium]|nr:site-specific DNA-methyltransferase [Chloroflexota bacterium]